MATVSMDMYTRHCFITELRDISWKKCKVQKNTKFKIGVTCTFTHAIEFEYEYSHLLK